MSAETDPAAMDWWCSMCTEVIEGTGETAEQHAESHRAAEARSGLLVDEIPDPRPAPGYPLGPGGPPPLQYDAGVDPYAIPAYRHARAAIAHEPRAHYEPPPPSRLELARRSYEDALELARSIDRLDLTDRSRILECIAAAWPEVVAAAIEDIARGHRYEYALELVPR